MRLSWKAVYSMILANNNTKWLSSQLFGCTRVKRGLLGRRHFHHLMFITELLLVWTVVWPEVPSLDHLLSVVVLFLFFAFFNCYLVVPRPTLGHSEGDNFTIPMLIKSFVQVWPEGHLELRNKVGSLRSAEYLVGFEPEPSNSDCNALTH